MTPRQIVILGSTGSIGCATLDVVRSHPGRLCVVALAAHHNAELLERQWREFRPKYLCLLDTSAAHTLRDRLRGEPVEVLDGEPGLLRLAAHDEADIVVNAVVGAAGLRASLETVKGGCMLALANKESLVAGGPLFRDLCDRTSARILPIDSEHSAVWQALSAGKREEVRAVILTASGGPFRQWPRGRFDEITVEQALAHPTWRMGAKITIDSATLVNKGLEVLEAVTLFDFPPEQIKVVIHPQSLIHSMVEYKDSSVLAQMSHPDMRLPITYALFWPERVESTFGRLEWSERRELTFEPPDTGRFPALGIAYEVARRGGTAPALFNAANETAVAAFLNRAVKFPTIVDIIRKVVESVEVVDRPTLGDILEADRRARESARELLEKIAC